MKQFNVRDIDIKDVHLGVNVTFVKPSNIYGCHIGDNSFIGPFVEIQKGVNIGKNCKVESHSFICECVDIGNDCFIGHGVVFINDTFRETNGPAHGDRKKWKETHIGNHVSIGSNATILPVHICSNVIIGAGSVVTKDIKKSGVYAGNPATYIRDFKENV